MNSRDDEFLVAPTNLAAGRSPNLRMGVFVDELKVWKAGKRRTCHLTADTPEELRAFAARVGVPEQCWHPGARTPHYDLPERLRTAVLQQGAVFVPAREQARARMAGRRTAATVTDRFRRLGPMHLYDSVAPSGNAYKVRLLLTQLELDHGHTSLDILTTPPETRSPEFLEKNPAGRIPVLELDDGTMLPESNAILFFLAEGTAYLADTRLGRAETLRWMFFEQYSHEPYVAVLKFHTYWGERDALDPGRRRDLLERGQQALDAMEQHLSTRTFFVDDRYGIADIALFAYTQSAATVGFSVGQYTERWLARVRAEPRHIPIKADPLGRVP